MKHTIIITLAAALGLSAAAAQAADAFNTPRTQVVRYDDIDLMRSQGAAQLYARLHHAAKAVCGGGPHVKNLRQRFAHEACMQYALTDAIAKVDSKVLSAYAANQVLRSAHES